MALEGKTWFASAKTKHIIKSRATVDIFVSHQQRSLTKEAIWRKFKVQFNYHKHTTIHC